MAAEHRATSRTETSDIAGTLRRSDRTDKRAPMRRYRKNGLLLWSNTPIFARKQANANGKDDFRVCCRLTSSSCSFCLYCHKSDAKIYFLRARQDRSEESGSKPDHGRPWNAHS